MTDQPYAPPQADLLPASSDTGRASSRRVGGWLLLLCLGLTIFSPLLTLGQLSSAYQQSHQYFSQFPGLRTLVLADTFLSVALMAFSIYAGLKLWRVKLGAVQLAQKYLITLVVYHIVTAGLPYIVGLPKAFTDAMSSEMMAGTVKGFIYAAVWYSYLNKSVRVQETFNQ